MAAKSFHMTSTEPNGGRKTVSVVIDGENKTTTSVLDSADGRLVTTKHTKNGKVAISVVATDNSGQSSYGYKASTPRKDGSAAQYAISIANGTVLGQRLSIVGDDGATRKTLVL